MAAIVVNQGLQRVGINASVVGGGSAIGSSQSITRYIMTMAVDDNATGFSASHTNLLSAGSITNEFDQLLTALATRSGQAITHVTTYATTDANFTIKRVSLHDDTATNTTTTSTTLVCGVDGQTLGKTSDFTLAITLVLTYT